MVGYGIILIVGTALVCGVLLLIVEGTYNFLYSHSKKFRAYMDKLYYNNLI